MSLAQEYDVLRRVPFFAEIEPAIENGKPGIAEMRREPLGVDERLEGDHRVLR